MVLTAGERQRSAAVPLRNTDRPAYPRRSIETDRRQRLTDLLITRLSAHLSLHDDLQVVAYALIFQQGKILKQITDLLLQQPLGTDGKRRDVGSAKQRKLSRIRTIQQTDQIEQR